MIPGERPVRGTGMARRVTLAARPYRWRGKSGWSPAGLGPMPSLAQERSEKYEAFGRLRAEGKRPGEAAVALGLPQTAGSWLEERRKAGAA